MDGEKIKNFFLFHVEKMILVVVIGAAGFLVWQGLQEENILETHQPDRLESEARSVRAEVDEDHTAQIIPERVPVFDIIAETKRRQQPVNPKSYGPHTPWSPPYNVIASSTKRDDPTLLAPRALQVHSIFASMAYRAPKQEYELMNLEPADPVEVEEDAKPKRRSSRRSNRRAMMGQGGVGGEEMDMMMQGGTGGEEMDMMMGMEEQMEMMMGAGGASTEKVRKLDTENAWGVRPTDSPFYQNPTVMLPPVPGPGCFIAGTAAIPYAELIESYKAAFENAEGYDPRSRDRPIFLTYEVQRADVTAKSPDQVVEADWVKRDGMRETVIDAAVRWGGYCKDVVPLEYRDKTITMWIPPVMLEDYAYFSVNPLVPLQKWTNVLKQRNAGPTTDVGEDFDEFDPEKFKLGGGGARPSAIDQGGYGDMGMDMDMEGGYGGGGYGGGGFSGAELNPPDFKLLRFYDFAFDKRDPNAPVVGRKYIYRVRIAVDDPNFPANPVSQPQSRTLAPKVYERVNALMAKARQDGKREPLAYRYTPWSEPSQPISLPGPQEFYSGPIAKPAQIRNYKTQDGSKIAYETEAPKTKMVISKFDNRYNAKLSVLMEVTEGTVLSTKVEAADIVDPITLEVKKVENVEIRDPTTVIDVEGGETISITEEEDTELKAPALMLLFDAQGNLKVHQEADDQEYYRVRSFAKERNEK